MTDKSNDGPFTQREIEILRGLISESQRDISLKRGRATDPKEIAFYDEVWPEFEALDAKLKSMDSRPTDTSQDVDEDEYVVGEDDEDTDAD